MFILTQGLAINLGFPDVCRTPPPVPFPNVQFTATTIMAYPKVLHSCLPTLTMLSTGKVSQLDQPGIALGMVSQTVAGDTHYVVGCSNYLVGGAPAMRLTSLTIQNCLFILPNTPGLVIIPSQCNTLALC